MHPLSTASATSFLFTLLLFFHLTASFPSNGASNLSNCNQNFSCGDLTNITYPFTGGLRPSHCGPPEFHLGCSDNLMTTTLTVNSRPYRVTQVNQTSQTLRLSLLGLYDDSPCIYPFNTTTFDNSSFSLVPDHSTLSLFYGCKNLDDADMANFKFSCPSPAYSEGFFMIGDPVPGPPSMEKCQTSFQVPFLRSGAQQLRDKGSSLLVEVLKEGFDVSYRNPYSADCQKCYKHSGGQCGFDGKPICICNDQLCHGK
ncbi:RUST RESISTANCE KINASE LR10-RELATED [Salix viminalis]|uniref:non-specific serine/threonine protein kinase n=1 Tax=Salix viminalis TaxID=40686 RepID=A0A9Q0TAY4_SALVM|nr:RUST RESISTANCE KINASE LR10-RELATED [Salix viminalis]